MEASSAVSFSRFSARVISERSDAVEIFKLTIC
jgi:hypothetical protein